MERIKQENPNTQEYWDKTYTPYYLNFYHDHQLNQIFIDKIFRYIEPNDSILDVGAGSGMITRRIAEKFENISACDFSQPCVDWMEEKVKLKEAFLSDIYNIQKPDKSYDVVLCTEVMEHLNEPARAIDELVRIARRKVIITIPRQSQKTSVEHVWEFSLDDMYEFLKSYGEVILTVDYTTDRIIAVCIF